MNSVKNTFSFFLVFTVLSSAGAFCIEKESFIDLDLAAPQFSELSEDQKVLISELKTNYCRLVDFYENVKIDSEMSSLKEPAKKFVFRSNGGDHFRMDILASDPLENDVQITTDKKILFVTPDIYAAIKQDDTDSDYYVNEILFDKPYEGTGYFTTYRFWRAPYSTWYLPIKYCIFVRPEFAEHFKITQLNLQKNGDDELAVIEVRYYKEDIEVVVGTFTFYRNMCWAIKETKWDLTADSVIRNTALEYTGNEQGIPLLSKVTYTELEGDADRNQLVAEDVFLCSVQSAPIPLSDFDVQQYVKIGLPEPDRDDLLFRITFAVIGLVLIIWGLTHGFLKE